MSEIVVIYHASCPDGSGAMWSAWKHFGEDAKYIAVGKNSKKQSSILSKCMNATKVYMLDCMLDMPEIEKLLMNGVTVYLLDHHISNINDLLSSQLQEKYPTLLNDFNDLTRSGAGISWDYFNDSPRPTIINYVEDFDLWNWALPDGPSIHTYIGQFNWKNNEEIIALFNQWENLTGPELNELGKPLLSYKNDLVKRNLSQVSRAKISIIVRTQFSRIEQIYDVPMLNANHFISETGNIMAAGEPFAVLWQVMKDGLVRLSLRSDENGEDVSIIAGNLGEKGGGHMRAAGTRFSSIEEMLEFIEFYEK